MLKPIVAALTAAALAACASEEDVVIDEQVELSEGQYDVFYTSHVNGSEFRVEVQQASGTPLQLFVLNQNEYRKFDQDADWSYLSVLSNENISGLFASKPTKLDYDGLLYFVVRAADVEDGRWTESAGRVLVYSR